MDAHNNCSTPEKPEKNLELVSETTLSSEYDKGDVVVWKCKKGFAHVWITCKGDDKWSKPNKKCKGEKFVFNAITDPTMQTSS